MHVGCSLQNIRVHPSNPREPRSSFNIGVIEGGSSINTIAAHASLLLDLCSIEPDGLAVLVRQVERVLNAAREAAPEVTFEFEIVGDRPAGHIPHEHPLAQTAEAAYRAEGIAAIYAAASTDANIPLSRAIPAICVGLADGANAHRLDEYIEPARLPAAMRALLWRTLAATSD